MFLKPETGYECNRKDDQERRDIGRNGDKTQTNDLLVEYEVIEYGIQHPVQPQVDSAANRVTECLERYYRPDRTDIKEVDNLRKALAGVMRKIRSGRKCLQNSYLKLIFSGRAVYLKQCPASLSAVPAARTSGRDNGPQR